LEAPFLGGTIIGAYFLGGTIHWRHHFLEAPLLVPISLEAPGLGLGPPGLGLGPPGLGLGLGLGPPDLGLVSLQ
jgi:hypothetical protein